MFMISECLILKDCQAWYDLGVRYSGVFSINPDNGKPFQVTKELCGCCHTVT